MGAVNASHAVPDLVNSPPHYRQGAVECIDALQSALGDDGFLAYCQGNAIKYCFRWRFKGGRQDLEKAVWYLQRMISTLDSAHEGK